jgi:M3 family oligoendopeptidase
MLRERIGYGPEEIARFRASILRDVVPLCSRFFERHAARLGVSPLMLHDELVSDAAGSPRPIAGSAQIVESARQMYHELHPACGAFMDVMVESDLLDFELREGKVPGGYCTIFADLGLPFVSGQFTGSEFDVHVLTHECGHAFQGYCSREQPLLEYIFPTGETSELFAMAMQLLTDPWMERFFGDAAPRYRIAQLERALTRLPLLALSDHFQHEIYEDPSLGSSARHALWRRLQAQYLPWREYGDALPHLATTATWQVHHTIYTYPFYSMDYALAWTTALQLHERAASDRGAALGDFLVMCKAGGSVSFPEMLELGRLASPFEPGTLPRVVAHLERALRL